MGVVKRILAVLLFVIVVAIGGLVVWSWLGPPHGPAAEAALASDDFVTVDVEPFLAFDPGEATTGLILYPGGRVEPEAYAPVARRIAERGYLVVIPEMPLDFAIFAPSRANEVIDSYSGIDTWVIGGHSLGGAMAATFAELSIEVDGIAMWAAYPAGSVDLTDRELETVALMGTEDGLVSADDVQGAAGQMPDGYVVVPIEGGNHAQFGDYGEQRGDGEPLIDANEQWDLVAQYTVELLIRAES